MSICYRLCLSLLTAFVLIAPSYTQEPLPTAKRQSDVQREHHTTDPIRTVRYTAEFYDQRLKQFGNASISTITYDYDRLGNVTKVVTMQMDTENDIPRLSSQVEFTNTYDPQNHLIQVEARSIPSDPASKAVLVHWTRLFYDDRGRLYMEITANDELLSRKMYMFSENDAITRVTSQTIRTVDNEYISRQLERRYHYGPKGVTSETILIDEKNARTITREWYDTRGLLTEMHFLGENNRVVKKGFLQYNDHGDEIRESVYQSGVWQKKTHDYIYNDRGLSTEVTQYFIREQKGKEERIPTMRLKSIFTYYEQEG